MAIFDCFTYFDEAEIVKIRFNELYDLVDYFVVVEADRTFTGKPKPFYFNEMNEKVISVKITFPLHGMTSWEREVYQRNQIVRGLDLAEAFDIIIISDVDEIPRASALGGLYHTDLPIQLDVVQYFWNYHWQVPHHCNQGARPVVTMLRDLKWSSPQEMRACYLPRIPNAGWHFSFFGEIEKTVSKIQSFAHTEYDRTEYKDARKVLKRMQNGIDPFDRFPLKYTEIDESYPLSVQRLK